MAVLGSTAKPTSTIEAFASTSNNEMFMGLTLPAGGPWRIYRLGGWMAGFGGSATARLVLWSSGGSVARQSGNITVASQAFAVGNLSNYEADVTDYIVSGGGTINIGFWRATGDGLSNGRTASGSHNHASGGAAPSNLTTWTADSGQIGFYVYYELANTAPNTPTLVDPTGGEIVSSTTPTLDWTHSDPDGDAQSAYQLQYATNSAFSAGLVDTGTVVSATSAYTTAALTRGTTYYWRVKTRDAGLLWSGWSATGSFKIASLPTATVTSPGTDTTAPLYYDAGSDTTPKFNPSWTFTCADGGTQTGASVKVYDAAGTTLLHTHAHSGSATSAQISGYAPTNGTKYQISVTPTCSHTLTGAESAKKRCQVRWGRASYRANLGSAPTTLSASVSSTTNSGQVIMEYASSAATTPEPTDWKATIAEVTKLQYVWHRVTLIPAVSASPTSPKLNSVQFTYSANVLTPDNWVMGAGASIDLGTFVYGTQSLKVVPAGATATTQIVDVTPDTDYILSGRMKTSGRVARIDLMDPVTFTTLVSVASDTDVDWTRYSTPVWNSGAATSVIVRCICDDAGGTAWFDALKLEASQVVTPWTPGFLGNAVVLDAGGISVDAAGGGVFRLRGSVGGTRDTVEVGGNGLLFAGDTELWSPAAGVIRAPVFRAGDYPNLNSSQLHQGSLELRGATPFIDFSNDAAIDYDARLRLLSDDVLAVEGAVLNAAVGLQIAGVGVVSAPWKYVPIPLVTVLSAGFGASTAVTSLAAITQIPTNAVAVQVILRCNTNTPNVGNLFDVRSGIDTTQIQGQCYAPGVASYSNTVNAIVSVAGRSFAYAVARAAGTVSCFIHVVGYFVDE